MVTLPPSLPVIVHRRRLLPSHTVVNCPACIRPPNLVRSYKTIHSEPHLPSLTPPTTCPPNLPARPDNKDSADTLLSAFNVTTRLGALSSAPTTFSPSPGSIRTIDDYRPSSRVRCPLRSDLLAVVQRAVVQGRCLVVVRTMVASDLMPGKIPQEWWGRLHSGLAAGNAAVFGS